MTDDYDLRAVDGSLWRLRRRPGESDADYAERRRVRAEEAATLKTYPLDWSDFEMISGPVPNGHLVSQIDDLAAIAKTITDDETLEEVVRAWREILSAVPLPGEVMPDDVAAAIERQVISMADGEYDAVPTTPELEHRHREDMRKRGLESSVDENALDRDDDYAARRSLFDHGGRLVLDVDALPIETVRRLNALRDVDIVSRIGSRSQFEEIEMDLSREHARLPAGEYVSLLDVPLDSEEAIEAESVAVQRFERVVELSKRLAGLPHDADDIAALEAVLALAWDYKRRSG